MRRRVLGQRDVPDRVHAVMVNVREREVLLLRQHAALARLLRLYMTTGAQTADSKRAFGF